MSTAAPIDCTTAVRRMWDALDGALDAARMAAVEAHLAECEQCPPHFAFARELRRHIAAARLEHEEPEALRARLVGLLRARGYGRHDARPR